jgi:DNA-binding transcriptional LysR family regulator
LPEVLVELARKHPRLTIAVRTTVDYIDVRSGTADVVLRARRIDDASDVYAVHLGTSITGCYVSPDYAKRHGIPATPEDLGDHDCIVVAPRLPATWSFATGNDELAVAVSGRIRVDSFRLARSLAVLGAGVLRTATVFADPLVASGELVPVLERYWLRTPIYAAHTGKPPAPKVRAFLALVREATARALPAEGNSKWRSA